MKLKKSAFTLSEIMIVLTIIAIITAILLPAAKNATPDENLMKFKKANMSLTSAIQELVNSDKYYYNGDLGLKANGSLVDDPKYFCNTLSDILSVKLLNCSDKNTGYNSSAVASFPDLLTNEIDGQKLYEYADCMCNTTSLIPDEPELVLSDNTSIYTINPYYHFGSKTQTGASEEKRLFNLCSEQKRYKFICMDIDGLNQGESPFGYALRADGKIVYGAKASAWIKASLQKKDDSEISFETANSCSPSALLIAPENDSCPRRTPTPAIPTPTPEPTPEPTCELSANCTECNPTTGKCIECEEDYKLADGVCKPKTICDYSDCGELAVCIELSTTQGLCMTKYNIGDKTELPIPSGITTASAGSDSCTPSESNLCCWTGTTTTDCDSNNGGYSGCTRTVCDWRAANKICESLNYQAKTWRLPTSDEWSLIGAQLDSISIGQESEGLMLCDYYAGYSSARCTPAERCSGSYGYCDPHNVWSGTSSGSSSAYCYYFVGGVWYGPYSYSVAGALSVRCVSDL